jgi:DNA-binding response OmpR family regulator
MNERATILLVERDEYEYRRLSAAVRACGRSVHLHWARNGGDARAYIAGVDGYADRVLFPVPDILLLDDTGPGESLFELVRWIRSGSAVTHARIIMLGRSDEEDARAAAKDAGADILVRKACDPDRLQQDLAAVLLVESSRASGEATCSAAARAA